MELNPFIAGMVDKRESYEYEWSSYSARIDVSYDQWLDEPDTFRALADSREMRVKVYRQLVEHENSSPTGELIRAANKSNKLTGGNKFVDEIENRIGVANRKPGEASN